ncbi:unnamed protein product [Victoria cruziana]
MLPLHLITSDLVGEDREAVQDRQFQMIMMSIQALSNTMQAFMERQQPQQSQNDVPIPEAEVAHPLLPAAPVEPAKLMGVTLTTVQHKMFMSTKPPRFSGREGPDRAEEWLEKVEKLFDIMDIPTRIWARFDIFLLIDDAKAW